ncbi:MAG: hypothetical protein ACREQ9_09130, partial [Candidatus Binatia bacterium]
MTRAADDRSRPTAAGRRVHPNAATANTARIDAAVAARDIDTLSTLQVEDVEVLHHPTGATWGLKGVLDSFAMVLRAEGAALAHEPLATLGDTLALFRLTVSAVAVGDEEFAAGATLKDDFVLVTVDEQGRRTRIEVFASHRLGDAVARLYERYAEILPEGPERERAAATARVVAELPLRSSFDLDRFPEVIAPAIEFADHRTVGLGAARGAEAYLKWPRSLRDATERFAFGTDDVLALRADALLARLTNSGRDRTSGGDYERHLLVIWVFGPNGLLRHEQYDGDRDIDALARFDELAAKPSRAAAKRRVRPNAATANAALADAAIAARDADPPGLLADRSEAIDHTTGATYDRPGLLVTLRALLGGKDPELRHEPLATFGDSLALCRLWSSASRFVGRKFDVGPYQREEVILIEVDAVGRRTRTEFFAAEHLGDAIARFYERYAELLAEGPDHVRAAATARSVAALVGPFDPDRSAAACAAGIQSIDHRTLPLGTRVVHGVDSLRQANYSWRDVADGLTMREDDILCLRPDGCVARRTFFGTDRTSGGSFERRFINLWLFDGDGLLVRNEQFDPEREDEALARFDELTRERSRAATKRRVRPNAATANAARVEAAVAARDLDALAAVNSEDVEVVHHPTGATWRGRAAVDMFALMFGTAAEDVAFAYEPLATLGNGLALCRVR